MHQTSTTESSPAMASALPLLLLIVCSLNLAHSQLRIFNLRASELPSDIFGTTDAYVIVSVGSASLGKTSTKHNQVNPWWEEEFSYYQAQENDILRFEVQDNDMVFDDLLGICQRNLKVGTYHHDCYLEKEGIFHYSYTLGSQ